MVEKLADWFYVWNLIVFAVLVTLIMAGAPFSARCWR